MDFVAVGYPSPLTKWAFLFLEQALRRIVPDLSVLRLDRFDADIAASPDGEHRLVVSMFPNPAFSEACFSSGRRCLVFADDLVEAARHTQAIHRISPYEALRPISAGLVLARPFAQSHLGRIVRRDIRGTPADILKMFLEHFEIDTSSDVAEEICQGIGFEEVSLSAKLRQDARDLPEPSDESRDVIAQVLGGLFQHLGHPTPGDITWPRQCFLSGDKPNSAVPVAIDVTGRARIIFYGPYLHLPRGRWTVRVLIGFSRDIRGMPFSVEAYSTELLGKARILAERGGIFEFEFEAVVTAPHEPVEIRIMNEQGAIEGHTGLISIGFGNWRPLPDGLTPAA
jgi:hypothetical protein